MASIKTDFSQWSINFQFRVDGLSDLLIAQDGQDVCRSVCTETLGYGLYFMVSGKEVDGKTAYALFLCSSKSTMTMRVLLCITACSLQNVPYYTKFFACNLKPASSGGRNVLLTAEVFEANPTMQAENAVIINALLIITLPPTTFLPIWSSNLLYDSVVGGTQERARYLAYSARTKAGEMINFRTTYAPKDILVQSCPAVSSWEEGLKLLGGSMVIPGVSWNRCRIEADSYAQYDSDFEDADNSEDEAEARDESEDEEEDEEEAERKRIRRRKGKKRQSTSGNMPRLKRTKVEPESENRQILNASLEEVKLSLPIASSADGLASSSNAGETNENKDILFKGVAARTWEAVLFYLYSGAITFAPLSSNSTSDSRRAFIREHRKANPKHPTPPSCKSAYRIAKKLGLEDLKKRALAHLTTQLTLENVLDEFFGAFTVEHEEVRQLEMSHLMKCWGELQNRPALLAKMSDVARGKLPHAGPLMVEFLRAVDTRQKADSSKN
ncbi:uncharacterized protein LAESUDRAFT_756561 [Laetiporus sulphureus 93-53]|uniref:BTB domain-containing protein n=1 Tax=Laetiporus sulphureus 93-53 TaxID=1314785 RepID=A0A165FZE6_9APHY|nr:uncharacterized protein LAESUDRAFT_756561 [Laetiporus sulphureus 93-53]KZT09617.1 hypothetical protein LAESUDRAFT_756561 [Laetiporus sulphureus 93-53]